MQPLRLLPFLAAAVMVAPALFAQTGVTVNVGPGWVINTDFGPQEVTDSGINDNGQGGIVQGQAQARAGRLQFTISHADSIIFGQRTAGPNIGISKSATCTSSASYITTGAARPFNVTARVSPARMLYTWQGIPKVRCLSKMLFVAGIFPSANEPALDGWSRVSNGYNEAPGINWGGNGTFSYAPLPAFGFFYTIKPTASASTTLRQVGDVIGAQAGMDVDATCNLL